MAQVKKQVVEVNESLRALNKQFREMREDVDGVLAYFPMSQRQKDRLAKERGYWYYTNPENGLQYPVAPYGDGVQAYVNGEWMPLYTLQQDQGNKLWVRMADNQFYFVGEAGKIFEGLASNNL